MLTTSSWSVCYHPSDGVSPQGMMQALLKPKEPLQGRSSYNHWPSLCACREEGKSFVLVLPFTYISIQNTMKFRLGWEWPARGTQKQCCLQYGCTSVHPGHSGQPGRKSLTEPGLREPQSTLCLQNRLKNPILSYRKEGTVPMTHGLPLPEGQQRQNGKTLGWRSHTDCPHHRQQRNYISSLTIPLCSTTFLGAQTPSSKAEPRSLWSEKVFKFLGSPH